MFIPADLAGSEYRFEATGYPRVLRGPAPQPVSQGRGGAEQQHDAGCPQQKSTWNRCDKQGKSNADQYPAQEKPHPFRNLHEPATVIHSIPRGISLRRFVSTLYLPNDGKFAQRETQVKFR